MTVEHGCDDTQAAWSNNLSVTGATGVTGATSVVTGLISNDNRVS